MSAPVTGTRGVPLCPLMLVPYGWGTGASSKRSVRGCETHGRVAGLRVARYVMCEERASSTVPLKLDSLPPSVSKRGRFLSRSVCGL